MHAIVRALSCDSLTVFHPPDILLSSICKEPPPTVDNPVHGQILERAADMAKKTTAIRTRSECRNWVAYLCEALVTSGIMPTWEAATYLTENLFGEKPNPRLLGPSNPHELTRQFLHRLYQPLAEAASREVNQPVSGKVHLFTDISLTGNSAVLVVLVPSGNRPPQLLLLDAVKAWDLVFPDAESFNGWAEERFRTIVHSLRSAAIDLREDILKPAV